MTLEKTLLVIITWENITDFSVTLDYPPPFTTFLFGSRKTDCSSTKNEGELWHLFASFEFFQMKTYVFQLKVSLKCWIYQCTLQIQAYFKLTLKKNKSAECCNYSVITQTAAYLSFLSLFGSSFQSLKAGKCWKCLSWRFLVVTSAGGRVNASSCRHRMWVPTLCSKR